MDQRQRDQANTTQLLGRGRPLGNNNMSNSADGTNVADMNPKRLDDIEVLETCDDSRPGSVVPTWSSTVSSSGYYSPPPDLEHEFLRSICVRQASMEQRLENIEAQGARQEQSQAALERKEVDSVLQKLKEVKISEGRIKNSAEIEGNGNHAFLCGNHATFNFPRDQVEGALGHQLSDVVLQPGRLPGRCQSKGGTAMTILIQLKGQTSYWFTDECMVQQPKIPTSSQDCQLRVKPPETFVTANTIVSLIFNIIYTVDHLGLWTQTLEGGLQVVAQVDHLGLWTQTLEGGLQVVAQVDHLGLWTQTLEGGLQVVAQVDHLGLWTQTLESGL
ncbi:hypothetical protein Bbelb_403500 [Branchiostoma belcheri]|nr:hypothetical protein Bbelb_403500 [Branchiostoma belcheri]